jgi:hypothetical protein
MQTISIRDIRGETLRKVASQGKLLAITNRRALIGVFIPVAVAWVEHLIDYNWSRMRQSVAEGADAMAMRKPLAELDDVVNTAERMARLAVTMVDGTLAAAPESRESLRRIQDMLNPPGPSAESAGNGGPTVRTVRVGELKAGASLIEEAAKARQTLAITHDRELIGIIIPITPGLVQFLTEQNMSRVLTSIDLAEKELETDRQMPTLDQVVPPDAPGHRP